MNTTSTVTPTATSDSVQKWYTTATVRNAARIMVPPPTSGEYIFPRSRQLLVDHPIVISCGETALNFILAQSAYKYMYEIGLLETRYVIDCALNIINNKIAGVTEYEKRDALTIVIDEGYHAYVALDFIVQMKQTSGIEPIDVPETNGNLDAVKRAYQALPESVHHDFQLISVCLAEHTLTKDLVSIGREKDMTRSFTQVMTDHVSDEGRHAHYFAQMIKSHWAAFPEATKTAIGLLLPTYLDDYLAGDDQRVFDRKVLSACGLSKAECAQIVEDTNEKYLDGMNSYITKTKANLVRLLQRTGVLEHRPTHAAFIEHGVELQS
jgi:para-aminobenzoate N-oxygenase AurF